MKKFHRLPLYAEYILSEKQDDFVTLLLRLTDSEENSLLGSLKSDKEGFRHRVKVSATHMLDCLQNNQTEAYITDSLKRWANNEIQHIDKYNISTDDIVVINGIRQSALLEFSSVFEENCDDLVKLNKEIVEFFLQFNRKAFQLYDQLLKQRIKISEDQLLEAQEIARVGSFRWNLKTNTAECSPQLQKILETSLPKTTVAFLQNVVKEDRDTLEEALHKAFQTGELECEYKYHIADRFKVLCTRAIIEKENGSPLMMRGTVQDISPFKRIEEDLLAKSIRLQESNMRLEQFAAIASHDLKEPLRKIQTYASLIESTEKERLTSASKTHLQKVLHAAGRMNSLIDNLLTYSSLEKEEEWQHCNLQEILDEVIDSLEVRLKEKKGKILSDGLPMAYAIPFQMQQLFQNLLSNALKFCKEAERPVILVSHSILEYDDVNERRGGKMLRIEISDNCMGFSQEHVNKVFDVFYRVHDKAKYGGSGLGLSICKKIVENHGGSILVNSVENEGSTFKINLPLNQYSLL